VTLAGASPNPFNPATEILFQLPAPTHASLAIYDVAGRMVRELASGFHEAGHHRVRWNGTDHGGRAVSSGVYFARLRASGVTQSRSLTLVR
jgi:flagellar hook assembly protein FlgD